MSNLIPVNPNLNAKSLKTNDEIIYTLDEAMRLGDIVAKSRMFPEVTDQAKAVIAILAGRELGVPPMASLRGIHVIKGKVEVGAGLLAALIKQSGKYLYRVAKSDDALCHLDWYEDGQLVGVSIFTMADAKRAKLIKPDSNWEKFPRAMLFARALTEGQKKYCPDIGIGAIYAPGEIAETDDVIEVQQPPVIDIPTAQEIFDDPRPLPDTPLPEAWTDDSAARQIADQQIANEINRDLKTIADEVKAEAPEPEPDLKSRLQAQREKHIPSPDPVPLKVTLTPAQQKVSDAVMGAIREHKKDKTTVLHLIGQYLGREVKRSSDLSDEEAEKVYTYLQTLCSQWSDEEKSEPIKYDQKHRAHNAEVAAEMDEAIKALTIHGVTAPTLSNLITSFVAGPPINRAIDTRYELDDAEAHRVIDFLNDRIAEKECEKAIASDEV